MKIQPISKSAGYNAEAAERARQWVLNDYEYALAALPFILHDSVQNMIFDNVVTIQKALDIAVAPQVAAISKAGGYWDKRNDQGEFAHVDSRKKGIRYGTPLGPRQQIPRGGRTTTALTNKRDLQHYQLAYEQVADEIDAALQSGHDPLDTFWTAHWKDAQGRISSSRGVGLDPDLIAPPAKFKDGSQLIEMGLQTKPTLSAAGAGYDLMTGMSNPRTAAAIGGGLERFNAEFSDPDLKYGDRLGAGKGTNGQTADKRTTALFNRMRASGELATAVMGDKAPGKLQLAAQVATFVGTHGPEAEKVIGPPTQRAAYRYRGVEKKPDPKLQKTIDDSIRSATKQLEKEGLSQGVINSRAREAVLYGYEKPVGVPKRPGSPVKTEHRESELIQYFQGRLPKPELYRLQRKSGILPPSQGVIIDRHGRVAHEAVGFGEDWYLPFNLKNLKALKGGEYVRTRAYGGLTTEDVYTGLVSGARSVTVVSNSGIFTLEFDDNFRGGRRLNDKAARMVSRYGNLLEAIQKGNIEVSGLDPSLKQEIAMQAARVYDPVDSKGQYERMVENEEAKAKLNPRLSQRQKDAIYDEVTSDAARDYARSAGYDADDVTEVVEHESQATYARYASYVEGQPRGVPGTTAEMAREAAQREVDGKWGSPTVVARTLGVESKVARAEAASLAQVEHNTAKLELNGEGYKYAGEALAEQFPYYVGRFTARDLGTRYDAGYVKPKGLKPDAGSPTPKVAQPIGGGGLGQRLQEGVAVARQEQRVVDQVVAAAPPTQARAAEAEGRAAALEAANQAQLHRVIGKEAVGNHAGLELEGARGATGENAQKWLDENFGAILDPDFAQKFGHDLAFAAKAKEQMKVAQRHKVFDVDFGPALGEKKAVLREWNGIDAAAGQPEDFDFGDEFGATAGGTDPQIAQGYFAKLLIQDEDIRRVAGRESLDLDDPAQMATNVPVLRQQKVHQLRQWIAADKNHANAQGAAKLNYPPPSPAVFDRLEEELFGLDKAAVALKHWRAASNLAAAEAPKPASGQVVEGVMVVNGPHEAEAAQRRLEQYGRTPVVEGEMTPEQQVAFRAAGGQ